MCFDPGGASNKHRHCAASSGMAIPMGYFNLDDNMIVQVVAFILTVGYVCPLLFGGGLFLTPF